MSNEVNTSCGSHCFLYHGSGHIQSCNTLCGKEMTCKDVVNSIDCNFCDIPHMILDEIKCRCVADLKWWYWESKKEGVANE